MIKMTSAIAAGLLGLLIATAAQATLFDRGGGMIYDSDQDITWLQDANYAKTSGYDADGLMDWDAATAWTGSLVYGGYDDWRLPAMAPADDDTVGFSGTDWGWNVNTANSELAYMFHDILNNESWYTPDSTLRDPRRNEDGCPTMLPSCLQNTSADGVNFLNLASDVYWSGREWERYPDRARTFDMLAGQQSSNPKYHELYVWAVRDGDVTVDEEGDFTTVPEPGTALLLGAGLVGLLGARRRKQRLPSRRQTT